MGVLDHLDLPNANQQGVLSVPNWKPVKAEKKAAARIRTRRKPKAERDAISAIRQYVFGRERDTCRVCRCRLAQSLHEIVPRSRGGKVTRKNSIGVCGQLGNGHECHGLCQRYEVVIEMPPEGAEGPLRCTAKTRAAADWLKVKVGETIESLPMVYMEAAE